MTKRMQKKLDAAFEKAWRTTPLYSVGTSEGIKRDCEIMFKAGAEVAFRMVKPKE